MNNFKTLFLLSGNWRDLTKEYVDSGKTIWLWMFAKHSVKSIMGCHFTGCLLDLLFNQNQIYVTKEKKKIKKKWRNSLTMKTI